MKLDITDIRKKLKPIVSWLRRYASFVTFVAVLLLYSWLVFDINRLYSREPSDDDVTQALQNIKRPKIDQATVNKIQQLKDNSVEVQTLFKQARDNPFQE